MFELIEVIDSAREIERKDLKREFYNFIKNPCLAIKKIFYSSVIDLQELPERKVNKFINCSLNLLFFTQFHFFLRIS